MESEQLDRRLKFAEACKTGDLKTVKCMHDEKSMCADTDDEPSYDHMVEMNVVNFAYCFPVNFTEIAGHHGN